jgi:hypothetical protein
VAESDDRTILQIEALRDLQGAVISDVIAWLKKDGNPPN